MNANEIRQKLLNEITINELIAVLENREIISETFEDEARIAYLKKHIKSISKSILKSIIDSQF